MNQIKVFVLLLPLFFVSVATASLVSEEPVCEIEAKIISLEESRIQEKDFSTRVLTSLNFTIEITKDGVPVHPDIDTPKECSRYRRGQEFKASAIKERNFIDENPKIYENAIFTGDIQRSSGSFRKRFQLNNVQMISQ